MIIMIKNYDNDIPEWHYWDNIDRVVDERILHLDNYDLDFGGHKDIFNDVFIVVPMERLNIKKGSKVMLGRLRCEQRNKVNAFRIYFNTEGYICNDDGKTIKKIVIYSRKEIE